MRITILGASGPLGRCTTLAALDRGFDVTAVSRGPLDLPPAPGLRHVRGDVHRPDVLRDALSGADVCIWTLGGPPQRSPARQEARLSTVVPILLNEMARAGVTRLVHTSAWGVGPSAATSPLLFKTIIQPLMVRDEYADKARQEDLIRSSTIDWIIVRPTILTNSPVTSRRVEPRLTLPWWRHIVLPAVSRATVADFLLDAASQDSGWRTEVSITTA